MSKAIRQAMVQATILILLALAFSSATHAALNSFRIPPDGSGTYPSYIRQAPTYVDARVLAANVAEVITIPAGAKYVIFSASCAAVYTRLNASAAVPAADVTDGTGSELNSAAWFIEGGATIGIIAPATCVVSLSFYN